MCIRDRAKGLVCEMGREVWGGGSTVMIAPEGATAPALVSVGNGWDGAEARRLCYKHTRKAIDKPLKPGQCARVRVTIEMLEIIGTVKSYKAK